MSTLALGAAGVHHMTVSSPAQADPGPPVVVLLVVALVLAVVAFRQLGHAMAPIGDLIRAVVSALVAAVTLIGLAGLLVWLLVLVALRN